MSVVFEGVEVPTACCFVDGEHSSFAHFEHCKFYNICKQRETIKTGFRPSDCPVKALEQEPTTKNDLGVDCISRADSIKAMQDKAKKLTNEDTINGLCGAVAILFDLPSVTPQELIHGKCNQCKYYEGVHNVQGHAPCSYHKIGGVLWNWYCSQFESEDKE